MILHRAARHGRHGGSASVLLWRVSVLDGFSGRFFLDNTGPSGREAAVAESPYIPDDPKKEMQSYYSPVFPISLAACG
jgi:hypothetical protein